MAELLEDAKRNPPDEKEVEAPDFNAGGYRFEDLQRDRIVKNRTDLHRKQRELGFPLPIKTGARAAWFPRSEVHAWLRQRAALRDTKPTPEM